VVANHLGGAGAKPAQKKVGQKNKGRTTRSKGRNEKQTKQCDNNRFLWGPKKQEGHSHKGHELERQQSCPGHYVHRFGGKKKKNLPCKDDG